MHRMLDKLFLVTVLGGVLLLTVTLCCVVLM
jgi:hypothetical protein